MITKVYKSYEDFLKREDKTLNGVLESDRLTIEELNEDRGNAGCFRCSGCFNCFNCSDCSGCSRCSYCSDCSDCSYCSYCSVCSRCSDCSRCSRCPRCSGCSRCSDCSDCSRCSGCSDCSDCSYCSGCREIYTNSKYACFTNIYKYVCAPRVHETGEQWIQMGCHLRTREEWEKDEWNNPKEFPNDGSKTSEDRHFALLLAYQWLDFNAKTK